MDKWLNSQVRKAADKPQSVVSVPCVGNDLDPLLENKRPPRASTPALCSDPILQTTSYGVFGFKKARLATNVESALATVTGSAPVPMTKNPFALARPFQSQPKPMSGKVEGNMRTMRKIVMVDSVSKPKQRPSSSGSSTIAGHVRPDDVRAVHDSSRATKDSKTNHVIGIDYETTGRWMVLENLAPSSAPYQFENNTVEICAGTKFDRKCESVHSEESDSYGDNCGDKDMATVDNQTLRVADPSYPQIRHPTLNHESRVGHGSSENSEAMIRVNEETLDDDVEKKERAVTRTIKSQEITKSLVRERQSHLDFYDRKGSCKGSFWPDTSLPVDSIYQHRLYGRTSSYGRPLRITRERTIPYALSRLRVHPLFAVNTLEAGGGYVVGMNSSSRPTQQESTFIDHTTRPACTCIKFDSIGSLFAVSTASGRAMIYDLDEIIYLLQKAGNMGADASIGGAPVSENLISTDPLACFELRSYASTLCWVPGLGIKPTKGKTTSSGGICSNNEENHVAVASYDAPVIKVFDIRQRARNPYLTLLSHDATMRCGSVSLCHIPRHLLAAAGCSHVTSVLISGDRAGMIRAWDLTQYCTSSTSGATLGETFWSMRGDPYSAVGSCGAIISLHKSLIPVNVLECLKSNTSSKDKATDSFEEVFDLRHSRTLTGISDLCSDDIMSSKSSNKSHFYEPPIHGCIPLLGEFSDSPEMQLVVVSVASNGVVCLWDVCSEAAVNNIPAFSLGSGGQPVLIRRLCISAISGGHIHPNDKVVSADYLGPRQITKQSQRSAATSTNTTTAFSDSDAKYSCAAAELIAVVKMESGHLLTLDLLAPRDVVLAVRYVSYRNIVRYVGSGEVEKEDPVDRDADARSAVGMSEISFISSCNIAIIPSLSQSSGAPVLIDGGDRNSWRSGDLHPSITSFSNMTLMQREDDIQSAPNRFTGSMEKGRKNSSSDTICYVPLGPYEDASGLLVHEPRFTLPGRVWNTRRSSDEKKRFTKESLLSQQHMDIDSSSGHSSKDIEYNYNVNSAFDTCGKAIASTDDLGYDIIETTHDLSNHLGFTSMHKSRYVWFEAVPTSDAKNTFVSGGDTDGDCRENQGSRQYLDFLLGTKTNVSMKDSTTTAYSGECSLSDIYDSEMHELRSVAPDFIELKSEYFGPCVTNGFPIVYIKTDLVPSSNDNDDISKRSGVLDPQLMSYTSTALVSKNDIVARICDAGWTIPTPTICSAIAAHPATTTELPAGLTVLGLVDGRLRIAMVPSYSIPSGISPEEEL